MCGIAGFTTFTPPRFDPREVIRRMAEPLAPRGPDGEGFYSDPAIHLGHRRLSIIDLEGGAQPMSADGGRYQIVFNGEIYNYIELQEELRRRGRVLATRSDTEVILHLYALDGLKALDRLNGMFAFALWDRDERRLLLARDRIGIKPLYYAVCGGDLVFASEMKSLLRHPGVERRLNRLSVSKYFTFGYVPAPHTIFENVFKMAPGSYLCFDAAGRRSDSYWDIPMQDNPLSGRNADECAEDLLSLLRDAVAKQLRADVPVGVFLSGGIDSSTLTALAAPAVGGKLHTFSVGFDEPSYDESPYATIVSSRFGTEHHHQVLTSRRALDILPTAMRVLDEPLADASILPTYLLSQFTARHVKVVLGGDGGDELFAGYPSFLAHDIMEKLSILPAPWRDKLVGWARHIPVSHRYASVEFLLQQFFKGAGISPEIRFFLWMGYFGNDQKKHLLSAEVQQELLRDNPFEDVLDHTRRSGLVNSFERILYLCTKLYLQDDILVKVDRASMANSLEVRVPFLDHHVVDYVAGIRSVYKLKGLTTKYILKKAVANLLPREIVHRRKAGFMIPLASWLAHDLRSLARDLCSESSLTRDGLFQPAYVAGLLDDHEQRRRDHRKLIWALLAFLMWRNEYGPA